MEHEARSARSGYALACHLRAIAWEAAHEELALQHPGEVAAALKSHQLAKEVPPVDAPAELCEAVRHAASSSARTGGRPSDSDPGATLMAAELGRFWHFLVAKRDPNGAWKHLTMALQQFHRCHWQRPSWRGANLGGWFLLEPGPASPFFDNCHAKIQEIRLGPDALQASKPERRENPPGMDDEHSLCQALQLAGGAELQRQMFEQHRASHYTAETMRRIVDTGLNAVRLPLGHWVLQEPAEGEAFEGPCCEALDAAVNQIAESGLQLLLDLHGAPGGESGARPCGRSDASWNWEKWRSDEAVSILGRLAARYCGKDCITGIQVCNEPAESIPVTRLCDFYQQAIEVIRGNGMRPERVAIVLPIFTHWRVPEVVQTWRDRGNFLKYDNVVFDIHYYHNFSKIWNLLSHQQHVDVVSSHALELKSLPGAVVGEWSISRPGQFTDEDQADFALKQVLAYNHASHGWFFWNWHDHDFYPDWDLERGVFQKGKLPNPLGAPELQGFLHPDWEDRTGELPSQVSGMWPKLMGWAGTAQGLMQQMWPT